MHKPPHAFTQQIYVLPKLASGLMIMDGDMNGSNPLGCKKEGIKKNNKEKVVGGRSQRRC